MTRACYHESSLKAGIQFSCRKDDLSGLMYPQFFMMNSFKNYIFKIEKSQKLFRIYFPSWSVDHVSIWFIIFFNCFLGFVWDIFLVYEQEL